VFENGRFCDFQGLVTLDRVILHTVMHHSSTSTYIPNVVEIDGRTDVRTGGRTFETHFIRSIRRSQPKNLTLEDRIECYRTPYIFHMSQDKHFITQTDNASGSVDHS